MFLLNQAARLPTLSLLQQYLLGSTTRGEICKAACFYIKKRDVSIKDAGHAKATTVIISPKKLFCILNFASFSSFFFTILPIILLLFICQFSFSQVCFMICLIAFSFIIYFFLTMFLFHASKHRSKFLLCWHLLETRS